MAVFVFNEIYLNGWKQVEVESCVVVSLIQNSLIKTFKAMTAKKINEKDFPEIIRYTYGIQRIS